MQEAKVTKRFRLPAHIRKNVSDPTLRFVLDKADPRETGVIPLVSRAAAPPARRAPRVPRTPAHLPTRVLLPRAPPLARPTAACRTS